jgi:hypothetical protein
VGIAPELILEDAETLALLRQLFARSGSAYVVRYGLASAGVDTGSLTDGDEEGSGALAFSVEEEAFIQEVLDRLAGVIAIQPQRSTDAASPFSWPPSPGCRGKTPSPGSPTPVSPLWVLRHGFCWTSLIC